MGPRPRGRGVGRNTLSSLPPSSLQWGRARAGAELRTAVARQNLL